MIEEKSYTLFEYEIVKIKKGHYRISKSGRFLARKKTLELAKEWIRREVKKVKMF